MKMNPEGLFARFYTWNHGTDFWGRPNLPDDFCTFFRWLMIGLLFLPLTIPSFWFPGKALDHKAPFGSRLYTGFMHYIVVLLIGLLGFMVYSVPWQLLASAGLIAGGTVLVVTVLVVSVVLGIPALYDWVTATEAVKVVGTKIDSVKNKYCPKIEWKR